MHKTHINNDVCLANYNRTKIQCKLSIFPFFSIVSFVIFYSLLKVLSFIGIDGSAAHF